MEPTIRMAVDAEKERCMRNGVMIDNKDNVVVATYELKAGDEIQYLIPGTNKMEHVTTNEDIPLFHKVALTDIPKGAMVVKYGEYIGVASANIKRGDHVHTHNCVSQDDAKSAADKKLEA
jgi:altronate dehydratase